MPQDTGARAPVPLSPVSCSRGPQRDPACGEGRSRAWPALLRTCTRPLLPPCPLGHSLIRSIVNALQAQDCGSSLREGCRFAGPTAQRAHRRLLVSLEWFLVLSLRFVLGKCPAAVCSNQVPTPSTGRDHSRDTALDPPPRKPAGAAARSSHQTGQHRASWVTDQLTPRHQFHPITCVLNSYGTGCGKIKGRFTPR